MKIYHKAYGKEVTVSALMDPNKVQYGSPSAESRQYPLDGTYFPCPYTGHRGLDAFGVGHDAIMAMITGKVRSVENDPSSGNTVWVSNGVTALGFAHLARVNVRQGQSVTPTTIIGYEGRTGSNLSGPHLHVWMEVNGLLADPLYYVSGRLNFPTKGSGGSGTTPTPTPDPDNTDRYEYDLVTVLVYAVDADGYGLNIRRAPGTKNPVVGSLKDGENFAIDRRCDLPSGAKWGRLEGKPWHWVCLCDGKQWLVRDGYLAWTIDPPQLYTALMDIQGYERENWKGGYRDILKKGYTGVFKRMHVNSGGNRFGLTDQNIWYLMQIAGQKGWSVKGGYRVTDICTLKRPGKPDFKGNFYQCMAERNRTGGSVYSPDGTKLA